MNLRLKAVAAVFLCCSLILNLFGCCFASGKSTESVSPQSAETTLPDAQWQAQISFPDWKGYTDDTLAMNSMCSFFGYHGQGKIVLRVSRDVESFKLYVNGNPIDTSAMTGGRVFSVDISPVARNGENTLQVSNILPAGLAEAVEVFIPYPEILEGDPAQEGVSTHALSLISDLIETDIEYGFTSAQLAVIRNGRLIYNNAWGKTNSYLPDGSPCVDSRDVTTDTLYDLASVTKMFSVNYAFQKLLTDGQVDLDAKITDFLGDEFASEAVFMSDSSPEDDNSPEDDSRPDIETVRAWKAGLTIRDLLRHQGGFPASPRYCAPYVFVDNLPEGESYPENPIFAGNGADEETRQATIEMIFRTPLEYEPGTQTLYSDVDYIILGLVVEKITGKGA